MKKTSGTLSGLFLMILLLGGCSSVEELDRGLAEKILKQKNEYPAEALLSFATKFAIRSIDGARRSMPKKQQELEESGLGSVTVTTSLGLNHYDIKLSEDGQSFVRSDTVKTTKHFNPAQAVNVVIGTLQFGEITGISFKGEDRSIALVEYTETYKTTGFGQLSSWFSKRPDEAVLTKSALFRLYDDGWRISE